MYHLSGNTVSSLLVIVSPFKVSSCVTNASEWIVCTPLLIIYSLSITRFSKALSGISLMFVLIVSVSIGSVAYITCSKHYRLLTFLPKLKVIDFA